MGHDTFLYRFKKREVGYLRRSMGQASARIVYEVFDMQAHDGGVSGYGTYTVLDAEDYKLDILVDKAISILEERGEDIENHQDILDFIEKAVVEMKKYGQVLAFFG